MARLARPTRALSDDDDEFPDINKLVRQKIGQARADGTGSAARSTPKNCLKTEECAKPTTTVRRRKLRPVSDNMLLRAWTPENDGEAGCRGKENVEPRRPRVELRARKPSPPVVIPSSPGDKDDVYYSAKEEVTAVEEVSIVDDTFHSFDSEDSDGEDTEYRGSSDSDVELDADSPPRRRPSKPRLRVKDKKLFEPATENTRRTVVTARDHDSCEKPSTTVTRKLVPKFKLVEQGRSERHLAESLSRLKLDESDEKLQGADFFELSSSEATPPSTPPKSRPGLVSPKKLPRIPATPHRPSSDAFWSQEFVDEWNDEHSPRKQLFPDAVAAKQRSPEKKTQSKSDSKMVSQRGAKKAFAKAKHEIGEKFLKELDDKITNGRLAEMAGPTGGVKLIWTNKLNTTAGRANWKRETIRKRGGPGSPGNTAASATGETVWYKHHASIELAEKVIDDEHRLLNVLAHEFCHLANFMISGVTTNPHGREFKAWAARTTRAFADRGIQVTTRHSYDIDFKYVWACVACGLEYKRHSKSIDPARHRCGACKGELQQTKPVPRRRKSGGGGGGDGGGAAGGGGQRQAGKVSEYQAFMKEHMRLVKQENPGTPQTEVMKIVASRWAQRAKTKVPALTAAAEGAEAV
ncbi:hypothetical protein VTK26DRAFT_6804 [Humicola hyalothermophila]